MDFNNIDELGTGITSSSVPTHNPKPTLPAKDQSDKPHTNQPSEYSGITEFAQPSIPASGSVEVKSPDALDQRKFITMLTFTILTTLIVGGMAVYGTITFLHQAEAAQQKEKDPFERYKKIKVPTKPPSATPKPGMGAAISKVDPTVTPTDTPKPTPSIAWTLALPKTSILIADLTDPKMATLTATLKGNIEPDEYVCIEIGGNNNQYFTKKKANAVFEKVCSEEDLAKDNGLKCFTYDAENGILINEPILPTTNCTSDSRSISPGTYVLYSKIFTECNLEARATRQVRPLDCNQETELYSEEFTVE